MRLPEKERQRNRATHLLQQYCEAYKKRDLPAILNMFTKDCNVWGTAIDECRVGLAALKEQHERDWGQSEHNEIRIVSLVPAAADVPFAAALCKAVITIDGKEHLFDDLRGTIVIRQEEGVWKIAHMHASFPDFRNGQNQSFPSINI